MKENISTTYLYNAELLNFNLPNGQIWTVKSFVTGNGPYQCWAK